MTEGRGVTGVVDGRLDERLVERTLEAAVRGTAGGPGPRGGRDHRRHRGARPDRNRAALWSLRANRDAVERLEASLGMSPVRATLALGAAIELARTELATPEPDLRSRMPELLRWLEGEW